MQAEHSRDSFIQYGCGLSAPAGWRNFDASPTLRAKRLRAGGFFGIRSARFRDNPDPALAAIEDESRWIDCLGVECSKP